MRIGLGWTGDPRNPRLAQRAEGGGTGWWTEALGDPPEVYGERIAGRSGRAMRRWDPTRSKLGAALVRGYDGPLPAEGERWLYLGASTGTTASHVADLVGPSGVVIAVERAVRASVQLLALAERYPNLLPVCADARAPAEYAGDAGPCDGIYLDIAQPDQVEIARANAAALLAPHGSLLVALKTASMGRDRDASGHLAVAEEELGREFRLESAVPLAPFHRRHFFLSGRPRGSEARPRLIRRPSGRPGARRR